MWGEWNQRRQSEELLSAQSILSSNLTCTIFLTTHTHMLLYVVMRVSQICVVYCVHSFIPTIVKIGLASVLCHLLVASPPLMMIIEAPEPKHRPQLRFERFS